jgi:molecular chaperone DnaK (HSP70)
MEPVEAARVTPGSKLMILDCGGGTIDITSSVVRRFEGTDIQLDELQLPGGGPWGGTDVDKHFLAFLAQFILAAPPNARTGRPARPSKDTWIRVREGWLEGKEQFNHRDDARLTEVDVTDVAPMELLVDSADAPARIADINARIAAASPAYAGSLVTRIGRSSNLKLRLRLSPAAMLSFFWPSIEKTIGEARRMLAVPDAADTGLVLVVGGYAQSDLLFDALREALATPGRRVVRPADAWKAVVRGAVLFGLSPTAFVTSRCVCGGHA